MKLAKRYIIGLLVCLAIMQACTQFLIVTARYYKLSLAITFANTEANDHRYAWDSDDHKSYEDRCKDKASFIEANPMARFLASFGGSTAKKLLRFLIIGVTPVLAYVAAIICNYSCYRIRTYLRRTKVRRRRYRQRRWRRWKRRLINLLFNNNI